MGNVLRIGVLGSGSGTNCEAIMQACETGALPARVSVVISDVSDARILERARRRNIPAVFIGPSRFKTKLEPDLERKLVDTLRDAQVDLVVLAGYMRVVKDPLLQAYAGRIINIHPSLLPSFPGLRAWEQAVRHGVKVTGCTVHFVDPGVDTGPIILQEAVPVRAGDTPETAHERIQVVEHKLYPEAIRLIAEGRVTIRGRLVVIAPPAASTESDQ
jgi:phosphoribosylglycinamide formyltransferase-1